MSKKYQGRGCGMGKRGIHHARRFRPIDRFEVVGVCDIDPARLDAAAAKIGAAKRHGCRELCEAGQARRLLFLHPPQPSHPHDKAGIEGGAQAHRLREARGAHHHRGLRSQAAC